MSDLVGLQRVASDDPEYLAAAAAEAAFWARPHPFGMESLERRAIAGAPDRYTNMRFTGDAGVHWEETICRWGAFRRGLMLGTSGLVPEARILATNPNLHVTFIDISDGALRRREDELGTRFPGRVETRVADLNFAELEAGAYDMIASSASLHHVTNLEFCVDQINRALAPGGHFFLHDYVGEKRFQFSPAKKRVYETIRASHAARGGLGEGVVWSDTSDLSPFCGVRSDEVLDVCARQLDPVDVRTGSTLTVCTLRSRTASRTFGWRALPARADAALRSRVARRLPRLAVPAHTYMPFFRDLVSIGDMLGDSGALLPGSAFGVYRRR